MYSRSGKMPLPSTLRQQKKSRSGKSDLGCVAFDISGRYEPGIYSYPLPLTSYPLPPSGVPLFVTPAPDQFRGRLSSPGPARFVAGGEPVRPPGLTIRHSGPACHGVAYSEDGLVTGLPRSLQRRRNPESIFSLRHPGRLRAGVQVLHFV
jgi:hypothetical protein